MTTPLTHEQIEELLGAYALDAVDADERETVELHLRECPRCRAEVADYREVAVLLAHSGSPAPSGVWDRILHELEPSPPALRMPAMPPSAAMSLPQVDPAAPAEVAELATARKRRTGDGSRSRSLPGKMMAGLLAAAAVVAVVVGFAAIRQTQRLDKLETSLRDVSIDRVATRALTDPAAVSSTLRSTDGRVATPVVVDDQGKGYLFASKMPQLAPGRTYQLWGQAKGSTVSLGVFDGQTRVVPFQVGEALRTQLQGLAVTEETAPGVPETKHGPVVAGTI